jgi:uroporphyrinogen decarboxylase
MNWDDTPEQAAFREDVRTFIAERLPDVYQSAARGAGMLNWYRHRKSEDQTLRQAAEDWARVPTVDARTPALDDQVDALRMVVDRIGPSVPVIQTVFSPLTVAGYLVGEDRPRMVAEARDRTPSIDSALARIADTLGDFAARSIAAGAAGVFFAISDFASADLLSLGEYEDLALPHDVRVLASVPEETWFNVLHLCGPRLHFELAAELDTHAVSWSIHEPGNPSLAEGRARSGRVVMGGIDLRTLVDGEPRGGA